MTSSSNKWYTFTTSVHLFTKPRHHKVYNVNIVEGKIDNDNRNILDSIPPNKEYTNSNDLDTEASSFTLIILDFIESDKVIYCQDGHVEPVILQSITCSNNSFNCFVQLPNGSIMITTREFCAHLKKRSMLLCFPL